MLNQCGERDVSSARKFNFWSITGRRDEEKKTSEFENPGKGRHAGERFRNSNVVEVKWCYLQYLVRCWKFQSQPQEGNRIVLALCVTSMLKCAQSKWIIKTTENLDEKKEKRKKKKSHQPVEDRTSWDLNNGCELSPFWRLSETNYLKQRFSFSELFSQLK